jgi:biotin carboxylase
MSEHVMMFAGGPIDQASRLRSLGESVSTSLVCRPDHLPKLIDPGAHRQVLALPKDTPVEEVVRLARALHEQHPVTRIATYWEQDQDRAAAVGAALGVATHTPETVLAVRDKVVMRERLRAAGIDATPSARVSDEAQLLDFGAVHGYPFVVKPVAGTASFGVSVVRSPLEAAEAYRAASAEFTGLTGLGVIAEAFHEGPQFSVEAFSEACEHAVVAVTKKYSDPVSMVEFGHVLPAPLDESDRTAIADYVVRVLDGLGVEFGPTHTEVVLTAEGPRVIETHLRVGGDDIFLLAKDATGVDMIDLQIRQTLGDKVLPEIREILTARREPRCEAIWYVAPDATGTLVDLVGAPDAGALPDVAVTQLAASGTELGGLSGSFARVAKARAHAATAEQALAAARSAAEGLSFVIQVPCRSAEMV